MIIYHIHFQKYPPTDKPWWISKTTQMRGGLFTGLTEFQFATEEEALQKVNELKSK